MSPTPADGGRPNLGATSSAALQAQIDEAAKRLEATSGFPAPYIQRVRAGVARLSVATVRPGDVRAAVAVLEEHADVDADAPLEGRAQAIVHAKRLVRKATFFATNHLATNVTSLGRATVWLGMTIAERLEQLDSRAEETTRRLQDELDGLRHRLQDLDGVVAGLEARLEGIEGGRGGPTGHR